MTPDRVVIKLPFPGFYNSFYDGELDSVEEREAEHFAESDGEDNPGELRLDGREFAQILFDCADYGTAYRQLAEKYVDAFGNRFTEVAGGTLRGLTFESMSSPKEYNFTTERIFAYIDRGMVQEMFDDVDHGDLASVVRERFTSRSGFISFYSNDVDDWLEQPLDEWDHNQLETLLLAYMKPHVDEDWEFGIYTAMSESNDFDTAFQECVDWKKFERRKEELRDEKRVELEADDPEYKPSAVRCKCTPDLF